MKLEYITETTSTFFLIFIFCLVSHYNNDFIRMIGMSGKYYAKDPEFLAAMDKTHTAQHDLVNKKNPKRRKNNK